MKIVVIGGTGLVGSNVVRKLAARGHEAVPASPDTGVNTLTGQGLDEALDAADVVPTPWRGTTRSLRRGPVRFATRMRCRCSARSSRPCGSGCSPASTPQRRTR